MKRILFLFKSGASINTVLFFLYKKFLNIFLKREIKRFKINNRLFLIKKKITRDYFSLNAYNFYSCLSKLKKNFKYLEIGSYEGNSALFVENYFNNVDQIIGKKIYSLRLDNNMSQSELGKKIGVSAQQLQKYENAKNRISAARLSLIAKVLDKDISYFYQT
jgi:DNA-binding transcriptional regulator YiaG